MKSKILLTLTILFFFGFSGSAQDKDDYVAMAKQACTNQRYDDAITYALKVLDEDKDNLTALWVCGESYRQIGFYSESLRYHEKQMYLDSRQVYFNIALIYCDLGYDSQALEAVNVILERDPEDEAALIARGGVYSRLHMFDEAKADFDEAMVLYNPGDKWAFLPYFNSALLYASVEDYAKAQRCMEKSLELKPSDPVALLYVEHLKKKIDKKYKPSKKIIKEALALNDEACKKNRFKAYNFYRRANSYFMLGDKEQAKRDYTTALKLYSEILDDVPNASVFINFRGACHEALGNKDEALKDYYEVMKLTPTNKSVQRKIDKLLSKK